MFAIGEKSNTYVTYVMKVWESGIDRCLQKMPHYGWQSKGMDGHDIFVRHLFK